MKNLLFILMILSSTASLLAQTQVIGTIDGETWTPAGSPYIMIGDLLIASLEIQPGVTIMADGDFEIEVAGLITAIGTEQDSIIFTTTDSDSSWQGMFFNFTNFESVLKYCRIENSINSGTRILNSTPSIENCILINNSATNGGAINVDMSNGDTLIIKSCRITSNTSSSHGGGINAIMSNGSLLILQQNIIENNVANPSNGSGNYVGGGIRVDGNVEIDNTLISNNSCLSRCNGGGCDVVSRGGGIYVNGNATINNCNIKGNLVQAQETGMNGTETSYSYGGGIYLITGVSTLNNCIISSNSSISFGTAAGQRRWGSGAFVGSGTVDFVNCTIAQNNTHGIRRSGGTVTVLNSIIYFNGSSISGAASVTYSDVQNGFEGEGNIDENPVFIDSMFQISSISPCVDAGNPDLPFLDVCFPPSKGTERNDMGAYGGPGACVDSIPIIVVSPGTLDFGDVIPNAPVTFEVTVTSSGKVTLNVTSVSISGANAANFMTDTTPFDLAPGENKVLPVTFTPDDFGSFNAMMNIESNAANRDVSLNGFGLSTIPGDVDLNGTVQTPDAAAILQHLTRSDTLEHPQQSINANVSLDTSVSAWDASVILQYIDGHIGSLPHDSVVTAIGDITMTDIGNICNEDIVDVPLKLQNEENISAFQGAVTYNPAVLEFQGATWAETFDNFSSEIRDDSDAGVIRFTGANALPNQPANFLAVLHFKVNCLQQSMSIVELKNIRWNEGAIIKDVAQSTLTCKPVGIEDENTNITIPQAYVLGQNYPNPFNPSTRIRFGLPQAAAVKIEVYNVAGQKVAELLNARKAAGFHEVVFDAGSLGSGVYLYKIQTPEFQQVKKMLLVK